jgi:hypothetical protein
MTPLVVTAHLAEPIVTYGDGLHLDGPLAFACFQDLSPAARARVTPIESPWAADFDLPLARWTGPSDLSATTDPRLTTDGAMAPDPDGVLCGEVWGWRCSAAVAVGPSWATTHDHRRRPAVEGMVQWSEARRLELGGGPRAARNLTFPATVVRTVRWYAVGDGARVGALLSRHVPAIGKLARTGAGRVRGWTVEEFNEDWSILGPSGQIMRRLPSRMFPDRPTTEGAIRAPYHHRSRWVSTVSPEAWASDL